MKVYIPVSDYYAHLINLQKRFLERYWPEADPQFILNSERYWTNGLIDFFTNEAEDIFVLLMDDLLIMDTVNHEDILLAESWIKDGYCDKVILHKCLNNRADLVNSVYHIKQDATYRTTLHPAMWKREYFLQYLKPNYTAWDFELKNMEESMNDGVAIWSPDRDYHILDALNIYKKGLLEFETDGVCREEDLEEIKEYLRCL